MTAGMVPASPVAGPTDVIGVVAVTYSPGDTLAAMLDSLAGASTRSLSVVLADNGSTDGSVEAESARPGVRLLRTGGNLGYGAAANAGVQVLDPAIEWIVVANPDLVFGPGAIDILLDAAARHPDAGALGPLIATPDGNVYPSARHLPSIGAGVGHALFGWWWPTNPWTRTYRQDAGEPVERSAGWLSGSCLLLRRTAFAAVDGFDPGYFMYFEDVDLGDRLAKAGWSSWYCPSAVAVHRGGHATERTPALMSNAHHRSAYRYLSRRYPATWQAPLRWALSAGLSARAFISRRSMKVAAGAQIPDRRIEELGIEEPSIDFPSNGTGGTADDSARGGSPLG